MNPFKSPLKTLVLIDGVHLSALAKRHQMHIEFKELRTLLSTLTLLGSPRFYTTVQIMGNGEPRQGIVSLINWLSHNGYMVVQQDVFQIPPYTETKWSMSHIHYQMTIDAINLYHERGYERLLLFAGNLELLPLIRYMRERGVQIDVMSSFELDAVAEDIRTNLDVFYEFTEYADLFYRARGEAANS